MTVIMSYKSSRLVIFGFLVAGFFSLSCSKENYIRRGDPLPVAFEKAMRQFNNEDYADAAESFNTVIQVGRGTDFGRDAQYYLAEAYFRDRRYLLAASEYERYSSLYPKSKRRQEVDFKEASCYYELSPRYKLDQKYTHTAIEKFNLFESRYPNSDRIPEIAKYENELRSKLARKLYNAADLYMRVDEYESAAIYYGLTIARYPESEWAERALVDQIDAYNVYAENSVRSRQKERYQKAVESYEKYLQLFPKGEHRTTADQYVDRARVALAELDSTEVISSTGTDTTNQY